MLNSQGDNMSDNIIEQKMSLDEKWSVCMNKFDAMLKDPQQDHTKLLNQAINIMVMMNRTSAVINKNAALDREVEIYASVKAGQGTYNGKLVLALTIAAGVAFCVSGVIIGASAVPGTALGNSLANTKFAFLSGTADVQGKMLNTLGSAAGQIAQGVGLTPKIADESNNSERTLYQYEREEHQQKRQLAKDSEQKNTQTYERALQQARDTAEKESNAKTAIMRAASAA